MSLPMLPRHDQLDPRYTWNAPSLFSSTDEWQAALAKATDDLAGLKQFVGRLAQGPAVLAAILQAIERLMQQVGRVAVYAEMSAAVDSTDQQAARMHGQAQALEAQAEAAIAFVNPELLAIGEPELKRWVEQEPALEFLGHHLDDLFRRQAHVRSAEVEELLGMLQDPFAGIGTTSSMLTNADMKFPPARDRGGNPVELTQATLVGILAGADRPARQSAWEAYHDQYLAHRYALTASLTASLKRSLFLMRARRHPSTLAATLYQHNIPEGVFHDLLEAFRRHLPTWQRCFALRQRLLGVERLQPYDMWAPLGGARRPIPYQQAVGWICDGLAPLGEGYVETVRRGCLQDRWVDVYPCQGKSAGAFSTGRQGTLPFIKLSYADSVLSLSTLAHELGHSMHSLLTWQSQPYLYSDYSNFVAEVASNLHQALVRAHLLGRISDPGLQIEVLDEALANYYRYLFIMPTLARFELEVHRRVEQGRGLSAGDLIDLCADLFSEGFGAQVQVDRPRVGIIWATFGHLYADYYVFQYATGISGALALSRRVLSGAPGAAEDVLAYLKAGSSRYPLDVLRLAGVDLTSPEPVETAFADLAEMVDRLERLTSA